MQLNLILYCVLLFCLEFSASVLHDINKPNQSGIPNIRSPYTASHRSKISRSNQAWNQRQPYELRGQYQPLPQINRNPNLPNNNKEAVPNVLQGIPQALPAYGHVNQQRVPDNSALTYTNRAYQAGKIVTPERQKGPNQDISDKLLVPKHQPILQQQSTGNPSVLKQNTPKSNAQFLPTQNSQQKFSDHPSSVVKVTELDHSIKKPAASTSRQSFMTFTPRIPSRSTHVGNPKIQLNDLKVKIMPSRESIKESKIRRVAPISFEDRYLASASNPVETVTKNLVPPKYNIKQFVSNSNIRNVLATTKHKRRFLVIHPNGTVEHVDKLETVSQRNPNYVLIRAGDIISNPYAKVDNAQKVAVKPIHKDKLLASVENTPVKQPFKAPSNVHIHTLAKPVSVPPKISSVNTQKAAKPAISAENVMAVSSNQKIPINNSPKISSNVNIDTLAKPVSVPPKISTVQKAVKRTNIAENVKTNQKVPASSSLKVPGNVNMITLPKPASVPPKISSNRKILTNNASTPPKMKIIYSKPSTNVENSNKDADPVIKVDSFVPKPVNEEIKVLLDFKTPISREINESKISNSKPVIIYGTNVTAPDINDAEHSANEVVVKVTAQSPPKVNNKPVSEAVAITESKPKENISAPVVNEKKVFTVDNHKTTVNSEALETSTNSTKAKMPEPKPRITQVEVSVKEEPQRIKIPVDDNNKNSTIVPSKQEVKEEKPIEENPSAEHDGSPIVWFRTSDPAFWEQLKDKDDVVYFFQIHNTPKVEYNTTRTIFPNGTISEETTKYVWEFEGDSPTVTKTTKIIDPENSKS